MSENKDLIWENTLKRLLGEKFDEKITEHVKFKKESKEFFNIIDNKQPNNSINNGKNSQPFQRNPLLQQDRGNGRRNFFSYHQNHNRLGNRIGMSKFKSYLFCIPSTSPVNARISTGTTWFSKISIPYENLPRASFSRKGETFCKRMGKINKRCSCVKTS